MAVLVRPAAFCVLSSAAAGVKQASPSSLIRSSASRTFSGSSSHRQLQFASRRAILPGVGRVAFGTMALFGTTTDKQTIHDFTVKGIDGSNVDLSKYQGKVVLIVNVASECGFTPQYKGLAELHNKYSNKGLVILGFPCNQIYVSHNPKQFGGQEPGSNSQIKAFAERQGAKFPLMAKVDVNGSSEEPLYGFLKAKQGGILGSAVKWNFTKWLVNKKGIPVKRYGSMTTPVDIEKDILELL